MGWALLIVLGIIVVFMNAVDDRKEFDRKQGNSELDRRKTNATLEHETLKSEMCNGKTFDEAYKETQRKMIELGYAPCIQKNKYRGGGARCFYSTSPEPWDLDLIDGNPKNFDSFAVKSRRSVLEHERIPVTDENLYKDFPKNQCEYEQQLKLDIFKTSSIPVGAWITYPGLGTCEIVRHNYSSVFISGNYQVKVIATGEYRYLNMKDKKIRRIY